MTQLLHKELTHKILGIYYDVYNGTSRTYPEFVYEKAMTHDLRQAKIPCLRQEEYQVFYKEWLVGLQRLDLLVADQVIIELKVAPSLTPLHQAQTYSYLKTFNRKVGLLLNFGSRKPEFERLYFNPQPSNQSATKKERPQYDLGPNLISPELMYEIVGALYAIHNSLGPGFIHRIYTNACYRELLSLGISVNRQKEMMVMYRNTPIATIKFAHLRVSNEVIIFPVAISDVNKINLENLTNWLQIEQIPLGILANFHDLRLNPVFIRA